MSTLSIYPSIVIGVAFCSCYDAQINNEIIVVNEIKQQEQHADEQHS